MASEFRGERLRQRHPLRRLIYGRSVIVILGLMLQFVLLFWFMVTLAERVPALLGGTAVLTAVMLCYVLNTRSNPSIKLSWCFIIAVLPVFGVVLYLYIQLDIGHRLEQKQLQKTLADSEKYIRDDPALLDQLRQEDGDFYNLAAYLRRSGFSVHANTDVTYFPVGEDKFAQMCIELEKAQKFIFLEYFFIGISGMWDQILEILRRKVQEGVEVRVMYDGTSTIAYLPHDYPQQLEKMGIRCKVFSPIRPLASTHYNNRDHRKILVVDGRTAFTGGVNLLDRYINRKPVFGHWKDTAVMVQGEAARSFTLMFLQMWNALEREPVYDQYLAPQSSAPFAQGCVIPYADSPLDRENVGEMVYLDMLNHARRYIYIMTPYLILDQEMLTAILFAAKRGVDVRIVLPGIPDKKYAYELAKNHYPELLEAGVRLYQYTPGFVHAKTFLSDDRQAVVGTINLDYRSLYLHFECAAYLYRVPALRDIKADFEDTMAKSRLVTQEDVKKRTLRSRLAGAVLKIAAPLM